MCFIRLIPRCFMVFAGMVDAIIYSNQLFLV